MIFNLIKIRLVFQLYSYDHKQLNVHQFDKNVLRQDLNLDNINLVILSDHGSRIIKNNNDSMLSVIYASRNKDTKYKEIKEKALSQNIFIERYK